MNNLFSYSFIFIIIIVLIVCIFGSATLSSLDYSSFNINEEDITISTQGYTWPVPSKSYISSYFGYRNLQLYGSGPYHSGIDIPGAERDIFSIGDARNNNLYWL